MAARAPRGRLLSGALHVAGFAQGTTVVMLPSLGNVLRDPAAHGLADREYGQLFLPFIVAAILAGTGLGAASRRLGARAVLLLGLGANAGSMLLLAATASLLRAPQADRVLLGAASLLLGVGFGLALPALSTQVARLDPRRSDAAVTGLHALVGVGTVMPALVLPWCRSVAGWWLLPILSAGLLAPLLLFVAVLLRAGGGEAAPMARTAPATPESRETRRRFLAAAVLYGVCEALLGNWGVVYLHGARRLDGDDAGRALATFWAAVTIGRALAVVAARRVPASRIHAALPVLLAAALVSIARLPSGSPTLSVAAFAAAGLGCSAILPLTISRAVQAAGGGGDHVAGALLAAFLAGQGSANLVVGWAAERLAVGLSPAFLVAAVAASALSLMVAAPHAAKNGAAR